MKNIMGKNDKDIKTTAIVDDAEYADKLKQMISLYSEATSERAFPYALDGLKPVTRRIIYGMYKAGVTNFRKNIFSSGNVQGSYHPYADKSITDAIVLLAQWFTTPFPYIIGQGNYGSLEEMRSFAAPRYLESKLSKFSLDVALDDLDDVCVDYVPNFDDTILEPVALPVKLPLILLQGAFGLGEGYSTSIMPHNIHDVVKMCRKYIMNKSIPLANLVDDVYPDFPTGGIITNKSEIAAFYRMEGSSVEKVLNDKDGTFIVRTRGKTSIDRERHRIIIEEPPFGVDYDKIEEQIYDEVLKKNNAVLANIVDMMTSKPADKSREEHLRCELICAKDSNLDEILRHLYKKTSLSSTSSMHLVFNYGENVLRRLSLKDIVRNWYDFRVSTKRRKCNGILSSTQNRLHVLEGLKFVYKRLDEIINTIKSGKDKTDVISTMTKKYGLSPIQARGICEMPLISLSRLSEGKLDDDISRLKEIIQSTEAILRDLDSAILRELDELEKRYARPRQTQVIDLDQESEASNLTIGGGVILFNKESIGLFDANVVNNPRMILNQLKAYRIDGKFIREINGAHRILKEMSGVTFFTKSGISKTVKLGTFTSPNTWLKVSTIEDEIVDAVPFYTGEHDTVLMVSKDRKVRRVKSQDLVNRCTVGDVMSATSVPGDVTYVILYDDTGQYLCVESEEIPILSRGAGGVQTGFTSGIVRCAPSLNDADTAVVTLHDDHGEFFAVPFEQLSLKVTHRTNKPKPFSTDFKKLKFSGFGQLCAEKPENGVLLIGTGNIQAAKTRQFAGKAAQGGRKVTVDAFVVFQL